MLTYTTKQGDVLDAICWVHLPHTKGVVEQLLDLNPDLAKLPAILPAGIHILFPQVAPPAQVSRSTIKLWEYSDDT